MGIPLMLSQSHVALKTTMFKGRDHTGLFSGGVGDAIPQSARTRVGNGRSTITGVAVEKTVLGLERRVVQFPRGQFGGLIET